MDAGDLLQEARSRPKAFDVRADGAGLVHQGEKIGVGPAPAEDFEALFAAAHAIEPVVDERHAGGSIRIHATSSIIRIRRAVGFIPTENLQRLHLSDRDEPRRSSNADHGKPV